LPEEEKKKVSVQEPEGREIVPQYPRDIFDAFDDMWGEFRRDFLAPWRPMRMWGRPWWRRELQERREACADLIDTGEGYKVCAEVPGIPKEKIDVSVTKDSIEISAKGETEKKEKDKGYLVNERSYSEIYRKISFPEEAVPENAEATLNDGLLEITVPKKTPRKEEKKHKISIK
jgi:HSP20 family protein